MDPAEENSMASPGGPPTTPALPLEVVDHILSFVPQVLEWQSTLHACSLLSRTWYSAAIGRLYERPKITGRNYDGFTKSICPSINAHIRKNGLAELVRVLDLSLLVHHGSKSLTARLLGRVKVGLEVFVAPQASFGINALAALSKCSRLRYLDLSLVSEAFTPKELSRTLHKLQSLKTLCFPRAGSQLCRDLLDCLPEGLRECVVTGGLRSFGLSGIPNLGSRLPSLTRLTIGNCDQLRRDDIVWLTRKHCMPNLEYLKVEEPMAQFRDFHFGSDLLSSTGIRHLCVPVDFLHSSFWIDLDLIDLSDDGFDGYDTSNNLDTLELDFVRPPYHFLDFDRIFDSVADGPFGKLRRLNLHRTLAQELGAVAELEFLNDYLKALAREDGEGARYNEDQAGIRLFGELS